jgi:TPR repeat protein
MRGVAITALLLALAGGAQAATSQPSFGAALQLAKEGHAAEAVSMFRHLSQNGDPVAQVNLAVMQALGEGVPQDDVSAAYWAWRARFGGEDRAIDLSDYLVSRLTDAARTALADRLDADLQALATQGQVDAFFALGRVALELRAPAQDQTAFEWFSLAAAFEIPKAALLRDAISLRMDPADRLKAQEKTGQAFQDWCQVLSSEHRLPTCPAD